MENLLTRNTLFYRSNVYRDKLLAANATQIIIVLAVRPSYYESLLNRCLAAAESAGISAIIVLNKSDLPSSAQVLQKLEIYSQLGYQVLPLSAKQDISALLSLLQDQTSLLVGQSGMGKSTIINALIPDAEVRTQEVSDVLDSGKHTTTAAHLYRLNASSRLIDSPGLQEFGLHHLTIDQLEQAFVEFKPFLGKCRFSNCRHHKEPDCAIAQAVADGKISEKRLKFYHELLNELMAGEQS